MRQIKTILTISIALLLTLNISAQKDAKVLLRKVYDKLQLARDYSVQANINVDMPFIHMLPVEVKIYFKQKDKFKVISKGIAIVPRQGFDQASKMLADTSTITAMIQGEEKNGLIKKFSSGYELELFIKNLWIINDFWITFHKVTGEIPGTGS